MWFNRRLVLASWSRGCPRRAALCAFPSAQDSISRLCYSLEAAGFFTALRGIPHERPF